MENQGSEQKPFVYLRISKLLQDVLKHDCEKYSDGWMIKTTTEIGNIIMALISPSLRPTQCTFVDESIKLYLPVNEWNHYTLTNYFITIKPEHQRMIGKYIDSMFRLRVGQWFLEGRNRGFRQKDIIKGIISEYGLWDSNDNFEMIKKMDYRQRKKIIKEVRQTINEGLADNKISSGSPELSLFDKNE